MRVYYKNKRFIKEILEQHEYSEIFKYPVVIDIGANIGAFSLYVYDFADEIYAIEPAEENLDCLRRTIKENKLDKIKTYEEVIACNTGTRRVRMCGDAGAGAWNIVDYTGRDAEYKNVNATTLGNFMDREGIARADLVKIDVEGAEGEILTEENFPFKRIEALVGELHNNWASGKDHERIKNVIQGNGFTFESFGTHHFLARRI